MVNVFFQGTIGIDGFSMVLPPLNHHHLMFFDQPIIDFNGFLMVFRFLRTMVNDVWKLQSYKKCVNSTRDQMYFCDTGERTTNPNSFRSLRAMKGGPIGIQFFKKQVPSPNFLQKILKISMILKRQLINLMILKRPSKISMF